MNHLKLRTTKFSCIFYGDAVSEQYLLARNFLVSFFEDNAEFEITLLNDLDYDLFLEHSVDLDTFCLQNKSLIKKMTLFLKQNPRLKFFKLKIQSRESVLFRISKIKFSGETVTLRVF